MTKLDKFVAFARDLSAEDMQSLEEVLDDLMQTYSSEDDFTPDQLAEIDRRLAEEDPEYADPNAIAAIFGRKFD